MFGIAGIKGSASATFFADRVETVLGPMSLALPG
jgi:hypothetical protein